MIVDSPASLQVGDAIALSRRVDALLIVLNVRTVRRNTLKELRRVLGAAPTPTLGYVLTGSDEELPYERLRVRSRLSRSRFGGSTITDHVGTRR